MPQNARSQPSADQREAPLWGFDRDELAYILPMLLFLLFVGVGQYWKELYPWAYAGRALAVAWLLPPPALTQKAG